MEHLETLSSSTKAQIATDLSEKNMDVCPCNLSGIQKRQKPIEQPLWKKGKGEAQREEMCSKSED